MIWIVNRDKTLTVPGLGVNTSGNDWANGLHMPDAIMCVDVQDGKTARDALAAFKALGVSENDLNQFKAREGLIDVD